MGRMKSRKFWAWAIWTLIVAISIALTKMVSPEVISWYGAVTMVYIGGQTAIDIIDKKK